MLRGTVAFLVLVVLAAIVAELSRTARLRGGIAATDPFLPFLAVGFLLGDHLLGVFPPDLLVGLRPVVLLGLAWIGLVFGMQVDLRILGRLRPWHRRVALGLPMVPGLVAAAAGVALGLTPAVALALGGVAAVASPAILIGHGRGRRPRDRASLRLLTLVAASSGIPAVVCFGLATAGASPLALAQGGTVPTWQLLPLPFALGAVLGWALVVLVRGIGDRIRLLGLLVGMAAAAAGAAAVLGLSPLPVAAVAGAVVANRAALPHRTLKVAHALDGPMLVALLVLVGASWSGAAFSWRTMAVLVAARALGLALAGRWLAGISARHGIVLGVPAPWCGLLAQGELALGLVVALMGALTGGQGVLAGAVAAMVVNRGLALLWTRRVLFATDGPAAESPP